MGQIKVERTQKGSSGVKVLVVNDKGITTRLRPTIKLRFPQNITDKERDHFRILTRTQVFYLTDGRTIEGSLDSMGNPTSQPLTYMVRPFDDGHYILAVQTEPRQFTDVMRYIKDQVEWCSLGEGKYFYDPRNFPERLSYADAAVNAERQKLITAIKQAKPNAILLNRVRIPKTGQKGSHDSIDQLIE